ncbi:T9SS type A sorting domain-containing protein [bacterium]|nr:T9SS type A sorting domain-containing protein [bacterium]
MVIEGNNLYFANSNQGLGYLDISNPRNPVYIGRINWPWKETTKVALSGYNLFVLNSDLLILDVSQPFSPKLVAQFEGKGRVHCAIVKDNIAYLANSQCGLRLLDISNQQYPSEISRHPIPKASASTKRFDFLGDIAYLAQQNYSPLEIVSFNETYQPLSLNQYNIPNQTDHFVMDLQIQDSLAYVAMLLSGLHILDLADPAAPIEIGFLEVSGPNFLVVADSIAYVITPLEGISMVNISDPYHPELAAQLKLGGITMDVTVSGDYAYVAMDMKYCQIVNISDPYHPEVCGSIDGLIDVAAITSQGNYLYTAMTFDGGFKVFNIENPLEPQQVASYDEWKGARGITVRDNYVYLSSIAGFSIVEVDLSNTAIVQHDLKSPQDFILSQNYPNPFNCQTTIQYEVPKPAHIKVIIIDVRGKLIETLIDEKHQVGTYLAEWDAKGLPSGIYFYQLISSKGMQSVRKMILLK